MGKVIQVVVYKSVSDEAKLAKYAELALPAMEAAGGRFLARSIPVAVKEGLSLIHISEPTRPR